MNTCIPHNQFYKREDCRNKAGTQTKGIRQQYLTERDYHSMDIMNVRGGPYPGDKILIVSNDDPEIMDLLRIMFRSVLRLAIVPTVTGAISKMSESFDLLWLHLPLPDLQTSLLLDALNSPTRTVQAGTEEPSQTFHRMTIEWPTLQAPKAVRDGLATPQIQVTRKTLNDKWIWIRIRTEEERNWIQHLLNQCKQK